MCWRKVRKDRWLNISGLFLSGRNLLQGADAVLKASKSGSALRGWLCYSLLLDISRKNCTEAWACLGLNPLRYNYPYHVPLLISLWAVSLCSPEHRNSCTVDSYRSWSESRRLPPGHVYRAGLVLWTKKSPYQILPRRGINVKHFFNTLSDRLATADPAFLRKPY